MSKPVYLIYLINPYNPDKPPKLFTKEEGGCLNEVSISDFLRIRKLVISYHLEDLFSFLPRTNTLNHEIEFIDICGAYKLAYGRPLKGKKGLEPWNIWNLIDGKYGDLSYVKALWNHMYAGEIKDTEELLKILEKFGVLVEKVWKQVLKKLEQCQEKERYFLIEKPINKVFLNQHLRGIRISQESLLKRLDRLDHKISFAARNLKKDYGIRDLNNAQDIAKAFKREGFNLINEKDEILEGVLDLYSEHKRLPRLLKIYMDSKRDKDILLRLGTINVDRVHPIYKCLGTITGRVLVESPGLQYIKRTNRDIFIPDSGKCFLYPDYSQFEPGIMASESKDISLIDDFNSGDLYQSLSLELFGESAHRRSAKILFLAFCYGMRIERMVEFASESSGQSKNKIKKIIDRFFGKYESLISWRADLELRLVKEKRIGTILGNHRYRDYRKKQLAESEKRWVISQRIQGSASVIFKAVILEVAEKFAEVDILLPMHDALLLQVPQTKVSVIKKEIEVIFKEKFIQHCPTLKPRVSFSDFVEVDKEIESF